MTAYDRQGVTIHLGNALDVLRELPAESVHCCVTSPPYYGLRDYGVDGQLGLEATPEEYVEKMVAVFEEVRRVLRKDGTCWVNMGDGYAASQVGSGGGWAKDDWWNKGHSNTRAAFDSRKLNHGLKPKDLIGMPWRLAFALRDAGWYLRQDIIWHKPSPMPESVRDRCTKAHEYVFLLSKSPRYYFDAEAIAEPMADSSESRYAYAFGGSKSEALVEANKNGIGQRTRPVGERHYRPTRNKRSVWTVTSEPFKAAHFATFPRKLIEPMILAGCPEEICAKCGAPWVRVIEKGVITATGGKGEEHFRCRMDYRTTKDSDAQMVARQHISRGFQPTCTCDAGKSPGTVLDPFIGSGTTAEVARKLGRRCIGIELNAEYLAHCERRLEQGRLF